MYIVTGISRGLGHSIVQALLDRNEAVIGIGRSNPFGAEIQFLPCDLSKPDDVASLQFDLSNATQVTLINNAGILGTIGRMVELEHSDLEEVMQVNVFAPMALTKKIVTGLNPTAAFSLVNISSGAATKSIPSWAAYCASKAALNRLTENFYLEGIELDRNVRAYAIAPGVIDTGMQAEIRQAPKTAFSAVDNFIRMKDENALFSSEEAAAKLLELIDREYDARVYYDLREL